MLTSYFPIKSGGKNCSSGATGDRFARLLGTGNGPEKFEREQSK